MQQTCFTSSFVSQGKLCQLVARCFSFITPVTSCFNFVDFSVRLNLADDVCEVLHTVLEPISFKADVRVAMKPIVSDTKMDVSGHLEKVKVRKSFMQ